MNSKLPALGPRGEGWVIGQAVLLVVISALGLLDLGRHGWANPWGPWPIGLGLMTMVGGGFLSGRGIVDLRPSLSPFPRPLIGAPLIDTGAYRWIRHPIYAGFVLVAFGWGIATGSPPTMVGAGVLFLLFDGKSRREEAWLITAHPEYLVYRRRTKRLIPWIY